MNSIQVKRKKQQLFSKRYVSLSKKQKNLIKNLISQDTQETQIQCRLSH